MCVKGPWEIDERVKNLIKGMIAKDPASRPESKVIADKIKEILHNF